jgi:hypothetical protein
VGDKCGKEKERKPSPHNIRSGGRKRASNYRTDQSRNHQTLAVLTAARYAASFQLFQIFFGFLPSQGEFTPDFRHALSTCMASLTYAVS